MCKGAANKFAAIFFLHQGGDLTTPQFYSRSRHIDSPLSSENYSEVAYELGEKLADVPRILLSDSFYEYIFKDIKINDYYKKSILKGITHEAYRYIYY